MRQPRQYASVKLRRHLLRTGVDTCGICARPLVPVAKWPAREATTLDHILPVSLGGQDTLANVQLVHWGCNMAKGATDAWWDRGR